MPRSRETICYEAAGKVLAGERGLNTPRNRLELAAEIEGLIDRYINFQKSKARSAVKHQALPPKAD